jgi:DNA-binding transcriptional LysR family regulator
MAAGAARTFRLDHMRLMCELARSGSLARASAACGLSQPATSRLLTQLERALGVTLFARSRRGVRPTLYGELLTRHAQAVMASLERGHGDICAIEEGRAGRLRIGVAHWIAPQRISHAVRVMKTRFPRLALEVTVERQAALAARLHARTLDLALAGPLAEAADERQIEYEALGEQALAVYARAGHPVLDACKQGGYAWQDWAWTGVPVDGLGTAQLDAGAPSPSSLLAASLMDGGDLSLALNLLLGSDMLGVLPEGAADPLVGAGLLCALPLPGAMPGLPFGALVARSLPARQPLVALRQILRSWPGPT